MKSFWSWMVVNFAQPQEWTLNCRYTCVCAWLLSCLTLSDRMDWSPSGSSVHGTSPGKNTGVGCQDLLQRIFPTRGSNPGLPHCRWVLYILSEYTEDGQFYVMCISPLFSKRDQVDFFFLLKMKRSQETDYLKDADWKIPE